MEVQLGMRSGADRTERPVDRTLFVGSSWARTNTTGPRPAFSTAMVSIQPPSASRYIGGVLDHGTSTGRHCAVTSAAVCRATSRVSRATVLVDQASPAVARLASRCRLRRAPPNRTSRGTDVRGAEPRCRCSAHDQVVWRREGRGKVAVAYFSSATRAEDARRQLVAIAKSGRDGVAASLVARQVHGGRDPGVGGRVRANVTR